MKRIIAPYILVALLLAPFFLFLKKKNSKYRLPMISLKSFMKSMTP